MELDRTWNWTDGFSGNGPLTAAPSTAETARLRELLARETRVQGVAYGQWKA